MNFYLAEGLFLPPINATLNGISAICLVLGFFAIKSGKKAVHRNLMVGALAASAIFLGCYLYYHYTSGHTTFPKEYPVARIIYLVILVTHIILAVANLPLIVMTVLAAIKGNFERHKKLARFTFPSWLYVSVTGVIIYFMIYQWFVPSVTADNVSMPSVDKSAEVLAEQ